MIVEFFGPPAVGKTTLTVALGRSLQDAGRSVNLVLSERPADRTRTAREAATLSHRLQAPLRRIARPAAALTATTRQMLARSPEAQTVAEVMAVLPQRGMIHAFRLRQYLLRLLLSWKAAAERPDHLTLFDQGIAQAVCSLATRTDNADSDRIRHAVQLLPAADLLIRVDAPLALLEAKLQARLRRQGPLERIVERTVPESLAFLPIIEKLNAIYGELGRHVVSASLTEGQARRDSVLRIKREIDALRGSKPEPPA